MRHNISRLGVIGAAALAFTILFTGPASAVSISDCVDGGGIVVRCAEPPITREDKVMCPVPGRAERIWCIGGFYHGLEILEFGNRSRYR